MLRPGSGRPPPLQAKARWGRVFVLQRKQKDPRRAGQLATALAQLLRQCRNPRGVGRRCVPARGQPGSRLPSLPQGTLPPPSRPMTDSAWWSQDTRPFLGGGALPHA